MRKAADLKQTYCVHLQVIGSIFGEFHSPWLKHLNVTIPLLLSTSTFQVSLHPLYDYIYFLADQFAVTATIWAGAQPVSLVPLIPDTASIMCEVALPGHSPACCLGTMRAWETECPKPTSEKCSFGLDLLGCTMECARGRRIPSLTFHIFIRNFL